MEKDSDIKFFAEVGWWFPAHERHLQEWMLKMNDSKFGRLRYQGAKIDRALALMPTRRGVAIDIGGHCGLWSYYLAKEFQAVVAFEPVEQHRRCFQHNLAGVENVALVPKALGNQTANVAIHTEPSSSGDSWVSGPGDIECVKLDDYLAGPLEYPAIDLIKLDCEGYEYFALLGGTETIKQHRPAIVVEQKPNKASKWGLPDTQAVEYLQTLGYRLEAAMAGDYFMVPK